MNLLRRIVPGLMLVVLPAAAAAQQEALRTRLESRGLPADVVGRVLELASGAQSRGLPADAVANKAIEGWAKHVPGPRLIAAIQQYATRLGEARDAVVRAGLADPPGDVVVAAGEAMGQGLGGAELGTIVRAGPRSPALAAGVTVAAALVAQGLGPRGAAEIVAEALRTGRPIASVLDLPSVARAMRAQGSSTAEIGRRMMTGGGGGAMGPGGGAGGARPGGVSPGVPGGRQGPPPGGGQRPPSAQ